MLYMVDIDMDKLYSKVKTEVENNRDYDSSDIDQDVGEYEKGWVKVQWGEL